MKQLFTCFLLLFSLSTARSQSIDTILFENFQGDPFALMTLFPEGADQVWVNFDEDNLPPFNNVADQKRWFQTEAFFNGTDPNTGEINYVAASLSYLLNTLPGNRNWLILPPIQVADANYTLHWKSAPYQMPRYLDGYLVMAAENTNDVLGNAFQDTLFQAGSMLEIIGDSGSTDPSNYTFTEGYLHANNFTDNNYFIDNGGDILEGLLEPHSVSLSQYAGKQIYLAFLHNSDDDNLLSIDDILVAHSAASSTNEAAAELRLMTYPNPVQQWLNVMFRLKTSTEVALQVSDAQGRVVVSKNLGLLASGEHQGDLNLGHLPNGTYTLTLQAGAVAVTRELVLMR